jgi:hypothetical protein
VRLGSQVSIGLRNLYEVTQIEEIINWLHELIAGVHVIKTGEKKEKADSDNDSGKRSIAPCLSDFFSLSYSSQTMGGCRCHRRLGRRFWRRRRQGRSVIYSICTSVGLQ